MLSLSDLVREGAQRPPHDRKLISKHVQRARRRTKHSPQHNAGGWCGANGLQVGFGELKADHTASQLLVDRRECVDFVFDRRLLVLVQMDLDQLGTVELDAHALADNLGGEDEILEDRIVDRGEGSGTGPLLLQGIAGVARRLGQDFAFADEHNVLAGELLLELAHQTGLDLLESLLLGHRHVDDDGLCAWMDGFIFGLFWEFGENIFKQ